MASLVIIHRENSWHCTLLQYPWGVDSIATKMINQHAPFSHDFSYFRFNPLPDHKTLDWSKLRQIADDILNCA